MTEYYGNNDYRDYLIHFGVPGMKWGKHLKKKFYEVKDAVSSRIKSEIQQRDPNYHLAVKNNRRANVDGMERTVDELWRKAHHSGKPEDNEKYWAKNAEVQEKKWDEYKDVMSKKTNGRGYPDSQTRSDAIYQNYLRSKQKMERASKNNEEINDREKRRTAIRNSEKNQKRGQRLTERTNLRNDGRVELWYEPESSRSTYKIASGSKAHKELQQRIAESDKKRREKEREREREKHKRLTESDQERGIKRTNAIKNRNKTTDNEFGNYVPITGESLSRDYKKEKKKRRR